MGALERLGRLLPRTLVVIIDQGEEVLTQGGPTKSEKFFELLAKVCERNMDVKLLIVLRTEFYGEFAYSVADRLREVGGMREEMLAELRPEAIARAIRHPAELKEGYSFKYEPGVVEAIVRDLEETPTRGGKLPVMQIVCGRLYGDAKARSGGYATIGLQDYRRLGSVRRQVMRYVEGVLIELCWDKRMRWGLWGEVDKWYQVLDGLARVQVDGTVTTNEYTEERLRKSAKQLRCRVGFEEAASFLCGEGRRILRRDEVYNLETGSTNVCYSLGHDSIGLAITAWREKRESESLWDRAIDYLGLLTISVLAVVLSRWGFVGTERTVVVVVLTAVAYMVVRVALGWLRWRLRR